MSGNRDFIIRTGEGPARFSGVLVVGRGMRVAETADGLPELVGVQDDVVLEPSGGDDAAALNAALERHRRVRLAAGTFLLGATVTVPGGRRLAGDGPGRTVLQADHAANVLTLSGTGAEQTTVEGMTIDGATSRPIGQTGIAVVAGSSTALTLRDLAVDDCGGHGVHVQSASRALVSNLTVARSRGVGLLVSGTQAVCEGVQVLESESHGIQVVGVWLSRLSALRVFACQFGIEVQNASRTVIENAQVREAEQGIVLSASSQVVLNACLTEMSYRVGLWISGGAGHVVNGFVSDQSQLSSTFYTHVRVTELPYDPASEIVFMGCRKVNWHNGAPDYEVDVSTAGARVVFIQHNFDPARINSGGNFASL
ncbi:MAG TPA: right-handed parallel beta-helix repeat-containing protein [Longimicrobium sp.]|nr:right-handed parallel beta-helix repeat-containing protein [Longimicrobium sp.]